MFFVYLRWTRISEHKVRSSVWHMSLELNLISKPMLRVNNKYIARAECEFDGWME